MDQSKANKPTDQDLRVLSLNLAINHLKSSEPMQGEVISEARGYYQFLAGQDPTLDTFQVVDNVMPLFEGRLDV